MSAPTIAIINYGAGNLRSVAKALESLGADVHVTAEPAEIAAADGLVLPGQGACDSAMVALEAQSLTESVKQAIVDEKPSSACPGCSCCSTTRRRAAPSAWASFRARCGNSRRG